MPDLVVLGLGTDRFALVNGSRLTLLPSIALPREWLVFVQQRARLAHSLASVEAVLGSPERWATGLDGAGGEQLLGRVGAHLSGLALYKQVRLHLAAAPIKVSPTRTVLPLGWTAVGGLPLFPELEGQLEVEAIGDGGTLLTMRASYLPPLGALGAAIDRRLLHRLAEATIKEFVDKVAARLDSALSEPPV